VGTQGPKSPLYFTALSPWVLKKEMLTMLVQSRSGEKGGKNKGDNRVGAQHLRHESSTIFWNLVLYFELFGLPCEFLVDEEEINECKEKEEQAFRRREGEGEGEGEEVQDVDSETDQVPALPPRTM